MNRVFVAVLLVGISVGCVGIIPHGNTAYEFFYELRAPKGMQFAPLTSFDLVTDHSASGTRLRFTNRREEEGFAVFATSTLIFDNDKRRALVVSTDGQPSQVFRLTIPRVPKPVEWSTWQRPTYTQKSDASWTFMNDLKNSSQSTNIPHDHFEMRYKVTEWWYQVEIDKKVKSKGTKQ